MHFLSNYRNVLERFYYWNKDVLGKSDNVSSRAKSWRRGKVVLGKGLGKNLTTRCILQLAAGGQLHLHRFVAIISCSNGQRESVRLQGHYIRSAIFCWVVLPSPFCLPFLAPALPQNPWWCSSRGTGIFSPEHMLGLPTRFALCASSAVQSLFKTFLPLLTACSLGVTLLPQGTCFHFLQPFTFSYHLIFYFVLRVIVQVTWGAGWEACHQAT